VKNNHEIHCIYYIIFHVIFIHDTDYMCAIIVRVRSEQEEYTERIHLSDFKTVLLRTPLRTGFKDNILMNFGYIFRFLFAMLIF
jgi:hypothetical protein